MATVFGPSGTMHERIECGEPDHVFASANMAHPRKLEADRKSRAVRRFVRNKLCAIAQPSVDVATASPLDVISRPDVRLGTSRQ